MENISKASSKQTVKIRKGLISDHHADGLLGCNGSDGYGGGGAYVEEINVKKKKGGHGGTGGGSSSGTRCCQAEKCTVDLSEAKQYHRRHKVCELHAKAQVVIVGGTHQRFCQQCSRFHEVSEFDDAKRSCRRRLAGHNERRRKSSTEFKGTRKELVYEEVDERGRFQDGSCERDQFHL